MTKESSPMMRFSRPRRPNPLRALGALAMTLLVAGGAAAATPTVDESQLLNLGFKVLVAATKPQEEWIRGLPPGEIRPMQRTGKKFYIFPDAARNQIYVGGPKEYEAYMELHPDSGSKSQEAARKARAYRLKQDDTMTKATAHDLSNPFLGVTWADLGWVVPPYPGTPLGAPRPGGLPPY